MKKILYLILFIGFTATAQLSNSNSLETVTVITTTTTLTALHNKIVANNVLANITITLPDALTCLGRKYTISRYLLSTGTITMQTTGTNQVQALLGTIGATTTIPAHSATGGGLNHSFTAVQVGAVGVWVRI